MKNIAFSLMMLLTVAVGQAEEKSDAVVEADPAKTVEPEPQYESEGISIAPASAEEAFAELSVDRAGAYLDEGAVAWTREKQCITCHTNGTYLFIRPALTSSLGPPSGEVRDFFVEQLTTLQDTEPMQLQEGTRPAQLIYLAAGLAQWDAHVSGVLSDETAAALQLMLQVQNEEGTWGSMDCWPPFESSAYQEATMAAMALTASPDWLAATTDEFAVERMERLRTYLRETLPPHDYARVLKLWASDSFHGILEQNEHQQIVSMILKKQRDDGGWNMRDFALPEEWGGGNRAEKLRTELQQAEADSEIVTTTSDGHMTGLALIVLQQTGASESAEAVQRGVVWIRQHQRESGRWWTRSLNTDGPHFITFSGTAYPLLALQMFEKE